MKRWLSRLLSALLRDTPAFKTDQDIIREAVTKVLDEHRARRRPPMS